MEAKLRTDNIFLIGPRGSGKTTVARIVADRLGWAWRDADAVLEERLGRTIRQIFADEGEAGFREIEAAVLREICAGSHLVVATGGGVVLREENRRLLKTHGRVIWLTAEAAVLWQRLQRDELTHERRPNLTTGGLSEVVEMLAQRHCLYAECAETKIDTSALKPEEIADAILDHIRQA